MSREKKYPQTPDGRYFVARGRLFRCTDPSLDDTTRRAAIKALMQARFADRKAADAAETSKAREAIEAAKRRLGEAGPVWWRDGAPDEAGMPPEVSSYADWWSGLDRAERAKGS